MYQPMIGAITLFPYDFEPQGWKFCDGGIISLFDSEYLFSLLGDNFGGNPDEGTFGLPDLRAAAPKECHYCISLYGTTRHVRYEEGLIGETLISPSSDNPPNMVECAGQSVSTNQNFLLQNYIGTRFGNAEAGHVKLPDLRGKAPAKCRYMMVTSGKVPTAGPEALVGQIMLLPFDEAPEGLRLCNGDKLSVSEDGALFSLLGNRFGGDSGKTFALPDLRAAAPSKFNYFINTRGIFPSRT